MKKLLSVILAGALALTAASPAFASIDTYPTHKYFDVDFSKVSNEVSVGTDVSSFLTGNSNGELGWDARGGSLTLAEDEVMGKVAKLTFGPQYDVRMAIPKGFYNNPYNGKADANGVTEHKTSSVIEFSFKASGTTPGWYVWTGDIHGNSSLDFATWFNGDGTIKTANATVANAYRLNDWNHVVLEYTTGFPGSDYATGSSYTQTCLGLVWVNGVYSGAFRSNGNGRTSFSNDTWTASRIAFQADTDGDLAEILFTGFKKYDVANDMRYVPATAGDVVATITPDTTKVLVSESASVINYDADAVITAKDLVDAIPVATGESVLVIGSLEAGEEPAVLEAADYDAVDIENVTQVVTKSVSGDVLKYYSVAEQKKIDFTVDETKLTKDNALKTLAGSEAQIPTVADLEALLSGEGITFETRDADGTAISDKTQSSTVVKSLYVTDGEISDTYTVEIRTKVETYFDLDYTDFTGDDATSLVTGRLHTGTAGVTLSTVEDADLGHKVLKVSPMANGYWGGVGSGAFTADIREGDKIVLETTIKPHAAGVGVQPHLILNKLPPSVLTLPFDFGYPTTNTRSTIFTYADTTTGFPYNANDWYHIVIEYTVTSSGSDIHTWINGADVGTTTNAHFTVDTWNTIVSSNENIKLESGILGESNVVKDASAEWSLAKFAFYRDANGYVEGNDSATLSTTDSAIEIDIAAANVNIVGSLTIDDFEDKVSAPENAEVKYFDDAGVEITEKSTSMADVQYIRVKSASGDRLVKYTVTFNDVSSDVYEVVDGEIRGVLQFTTPEQFLENISCGTDAELDDEYEYIPDGAILYTNDYENEYTIKLAEEAHLTGSAATEDGIHNGLPGAGTIESVDGTGLKKDDKVLKLTYSGWQFRFLMLESDTSNNGSMTPAIGENEVWNTEFSFMLPELGSKVFFVKDGNQVFYLQADGSFSIDADGRHPIDVEKYVPGEWRHVAISAKQGFEDGVRNGVEFKTYMDGDLVYEGTDFMGLEDNKTSFQIEGKEEGTVCYVDDIKYYKSATWGFDAESKYGTKGIELKDSSKATIVNGDIWLANGASVADAIKTVAALDKDGNSVNLSELTADGAFFVKTAPIIKKFKFSDDVLSSSVTDGTLTVNVGMVDDAKLPAIFVAGSDGTAFTNIYKVSKDHVCDDTITFNLNEVGEGTTEVKVYVWDASLTSLADVVTYTKTAGSWN